MRCLSCNYDLHNLTPAPRESRIHRCPECARVFDADDPRTFASRSKTRGWLRDIVVILCILSPLWVPLLWMWLFRFT